MVTEVMAPVAVPVEPTTPIKPSEALRLGRLIRPRRVEGEYFDGDDGACALGAILTGWGYRPKSWWTVAEREQLNAALPMRLARRVVGLNDTDHWTDDQIADWLAEQGL